ncbi:MAG TPA: hypothetical protein VK686_18510 [Bryobacteraceae bacterium]|jgi:hypothetical protein|nr:hypothetical protein [Bryobacteraceae bacterium]
MHVNPLTNNATSASSVQQQADVLSNTNAQFLAELQQIQSPQQFQAMLSNTTGQPQPPISSGAPVPSHQCQGHNSRTSQLGASQSSAVQPTPVSAIQVRIASLFQPAQSPAL